jgi:hypothetical protein
MLKAKRILIKQAGGKCVSESLVKLIQELKEIIRENNDVIAIMLKAEARIFYIKPFLTIGVIVLLAVITSIYFLV